MYTLYSYFRSSAVFRVRIALQLKGLSYDVIPVHLVRDGGEQRQPAYRRINPAQLVPALTDGDATLTQSLAIMEYLDEAHPETHRLLPGNALQRAHIRALALSIACDIHPLNNLRVLGYLKNELAVSEEQKAAWYRHWIATGFTALEQQLAHSAGTFCHGDQPTLADCCLVPQVFNARRFDVAMQPYPTITRIAEHCMTLTAFKAAAPERQIDAE